MFVSKRARSMLLSTWFCVTASRFARIIEPHFTQVTTHRQMVKSIRAKSLDLNSRFHNFQ